MTPYPFEDTPQVYPAGTVLEVRVYGLIRHVGLATGYGTVIHASRRFGRVEETDMAAFLAGGRAKVLPYHHPSLSGPQIVARARSKKGRRYNVLFNNCEHFITWALEGKARSGQLGPADPRRFTRD